jgi:hypothetical protein
VVVGGLEQAASDSMASTAAAARPAGAFIDAGLAGQLDEIERVWMFMAIGVPGQRP